MEATGGAWRNGVMALLALAAVLACTTTMAAATLPFSGSPIIHYDYPFYIFSQRSGAYCDRRRNGSISNIYCDTGKTTPEGMAQFVITEGEGAGPVPSSTTINGALGMYPLKQYCAVVGPATDAAHDIWCDMPLVSPFFQFVNNVWPPPDPWLHGNSTPVLFKTTLGAPNSWCTAPPPYNNQGFVECNRLLFDVWETFYFVVV